MKQAMLLPFDLGVPAKHHPWEAIKLLARLALMRALTEIIVIRLCDWFERGCINCSSAVAESGVVTAKGMFGRSIL